MSKSAAEKKVGAKYRRSVSRRDIFARGFHLSGLGRLARISTAQSNGRFIVLAYHRLCHQIEIPTDYRSDIELVSATIDDFEWQVRFLQRKFNLIRFRDVIDALNGTTSLPPNAALITFDDGFIDFYEIALPILRRLGESACVFVTTSLVGTQATFWYERLAYCMLAAENVGTTFEFGGSRWRLNEERRRRQTQLQDLLKLLKRCADVDRKHFLNELESRCSSSFATASAEQKAGSKLMSWANLKEAFDAGIEIGAHTRTHPILSRLNDEQVEFEIAGSAADIMRNLGIRPTVFAYPNGKAADIEVRTETAVRSAGFELAVDFEHGVNYLSRLNRYRVQRIGVSHRMSREYFAALVTLPGWIR